APMSPTDPAPGTGDLWPRLVLYDGECGLCNRTVRWLVAVDRERKFRYAPLQGQLGGRLRAERGDIPEGLDTFVYLEHGRAHLRSSAFVRAARQLPYPWR